MHGHMGLDGITLKHVPLVLVNKELNVIAIKGPVPGARNSLVTITFQSEIDSSSIQNSKNQII